jgi:type I restriction enzyme S subunit
VLVGDIYKTVSETYSNDSEYVVLVNTSDVLQGKLLNHEKVRNKNLKGQFKKTFQKNDILFSEIRPINQRNAFVDFEADDYIASTKLMVLRPKDNTILPEYMFRFLNSHGVLRFLQSLAETRSGTFPQITFSEVAHLSMKLPPLPTQRVIVDTLSCLDAKIEVNNRIIKNLEEQAQAIFKSWFIDFGPFQEGEFVESTLGNIPRDWKVGRLDDLMEITSGKRPGIREGLPINGIKVPVVGASKIMGYTNEVLFDDKIIVIGRVGTHGVIQRFDYPCWPSDNTLVIKSHFYEFVYQSLKLVNFSALNRGSTQPLITQSDLKSLEIVIPPHRVLEDYEKLASTLMSPARVNEKQNTTLATLRDTLLPKLMSGEIEVPIDQ